MMAIRPQTHEIPLAELVSGLGLRGDTDARVQISGITLDSRDVTPGAIYVALPGSRAHGAEFAARAVGAGAVAVLTDEAGSERSRATGVPVLVSDSLRQDMSLLSARVFDEPAGRLALLGVTGTNGKTTTVALLEAGLAAAGVRVGTIGTVGFRLDGVAVPSDRGTVTTPEAPDLQALLAVMADRGAEAVALEVSSHAMALQRVHGVEFDVVAFLNLGHDHLDFHADLDEYFEAKAALFTPAHASRAVVWVDDPKGAEVAARALTSGMDVVTVGSTPGCDYQLVDHHPVPPLGGRSTVLRDGEQLELVIGLPGRHNMIDAVLALAMLELGGHEASAVLRGLAQAQVPGRMQALSLPPEAPTVIIDFAHTPQAVAATLDALRESFDHVVTVIGCGGDRDAAKRPGMGRAAALRSDVVIITDDNPRTEDPAAIRAATLAGALEAGSGAHVEEVAGRRAAISAALAAAGRSSVVAILGKGHEQGQHVGDQVFPFDDAVEARSAWDRSREGS